jgi:hypothetical protein
LTSRTINKEKIDFGSSHATIIAIIDATEIVDDDLVMRCLDAGYDILLLKHPS